MRHVIPCMVCCLLFAACQRSFDPANHVEGLRVLAVRAEPPEVAPGESTTLDALALDTDGSPVTLSWSACTLPSLPGTSSAIVRCLQTEHASFVLPLGKGAMVTASVPKVDLAKLGIADDTGGVYMPILLHAKDKNDELDAVYSLRIGNSKTPNQNPLIDAIEVVAADGKTKPLLEDKPLTVHQGDKLTLRATFEKGSAESYAATVPGGKKQVEELLRVSWLSTAGSYSERDTGVDRPNTEWRADKYLPKSGKTIDLYIVARDERGGTDFTHRTLLFK